MYRTVLNAAIALGFVVSLSLGAGPQAQTRDTFSATAVAGTTKVPIAFGIDRYTTDAEDAALRDALKQGPAALLKALKAMPDVGVITVRDKRVAVKYAYKPPRNAGRTITLLTAEPIAYLDPSVKDKPKAGYDLALARLDFSTPGFGVGEVDPAVKVAINETGLIVTQDYGAAAVRLSNVEKK